MQTIADVAYKWIWLVCLHKRCVQFQWRSINIAMRTQRCQLEETALILLTYLLIWLSALSSITDGRMLHTSGLSSARYLNKRDRESRIQMILWLTHKRYVGCMWTCKTMQRHKLKEFYLWHLYSNRYSCHRGSSIMAVTNVNRPLHKRLRSHQRHCQWRSDKLCMVHSEFDVVTILR